MHYKTGKSHFSFWGQVSALLARQDLMAVAASGTEPLRGRKLGSKGTDRGGIGVPLVSPRACAMT